MKEYYEILGLNEDATLEDVNNAYEKLKEELYELRNSGKISRAEFRERYDKLTIAHDSIIANAKNIAAEKALVTEVKKESKKEEEKKKIEEQTGAIVAVPVVNKTNTVNTDEKIKVTNKTKVEEKTGAKKSGRGWKIAAGILALLVLIGAVKGCHDSKLRQSTGAEVNGRPAVVETMNPGQSTGETQGTPETSTETPGSTEADTKANDDYADREVVVDLGDITDDTLVMARAQEMADELKKAGIVNPRTTVPWDAEYIFQLIQYANGVYVPETMEEIDILHLDLLNLVMAPLELEYYGNHIGYVNGADFLLPTLDPLNPNPGEFSFGTAFAEYGQNGVYPLVQWLQQKRYEIYRATDKETIIAIYNEVGQVMADLMKGDGCTITLYDGKDAKEGITYHFTSEQVLANHSSALLVTSEAQMILANKWQRTLEDGTVEAAPSYWEVSKKSMPEDWRDKVSLDEIIIWINNGCEEQLIDEKFPGGQTFGQRIQGDMEGMAQNNYAMQHEGKTLGK